MSTKTKLVKRDGKNGQFQKGNRSGGPPSRALIKQMMAAFEEKADPTWRACNLWGKDYAKHRRRELVRLFQRISAGTGAAVESAGIAMADSRFIRTMAMADDTLSTKERATLLKLACQLADSAAAREKDAYEMASRETKLLKDASEDESLKSLSLTAYHHPVVSGDFSSKTPRVYEDAVDMALKAAQKKEREDEQEQAPTLVRAYPVEPEEEPEED